MKKYNLLYLFVLGILMIYIFGACASPKVTLNATSSAVELTDYNTFDFYKVEASGDTTSSFNQRLAYFKDLIIREMNARGLKQDPTHPELKVNLGINIEEKTQTRETSLADPGEWTYIGQRNYKWESETVEVGSYKEGSISLHLVDTENNEAAWVGLIEGVLPVNPTKGRARLSQAVASLFAKIDQSEESRHAQNGGTPTQ